MIDESAKFYAQSTINGIHCQMSEEGINYNVREMLLFLNGQPDVFDRLTGEGRLLYIIALLVAQS